MFERRENKSKQEVGVTRSGKRHRVDTRKRSCGQAPKTFVETDYCPLLCGSKSEREEIHPNNPEVTSQYSPSQPESSQKLESKWLAILSYPFQRNWIGGSRTVFVFM